MSETKSKFGNQLAHYRRRMRMNQRYVARLMDQRCPSAISEFEHGVSIPTLSSALKLAIIYRTPVEFLFKDAFLLLREEIRKREERTPKGRQGVLPLVMP